MAWRALAADPDVERRGGQILTVRQLADTYGVSDVEGSRPECWGLVVDHGMGGGEGVIAQCR